MDLFEYQARDLFESYGVPVLAGIIADTPAEASYYRHGGILQYVLRQLLDDAPMAAAPA